MILDGANNAVGPVESHHTPLSSTNEGGEGGGDGGRKGPLVFDDSCQTNADRNSAIYRPHQWPVFRWGTAAMGEFLRHQIPRVANTMSAPEGSEVVDYGESPE